MFILISEHILAPKLEHFVFHFLKMSSLESHSPRLQTARPLVGVWGLSQNIFCFPLKSNGANDVPATQQRQILDAMQSSLSNPGRLDSFPSPHRFPHNSGWCVTGKHRPWLLAADPNICLRATRCLQSRVGSTHASVGLLMSLSCTGSLVVTRLLLHRSTGTHVWGTSGANMGNARQLNRKQHNVSSS